MNVANPCRAAELSVKLCFFVSVRNANGRRVAGGSITGNILGRVGCALGSGNGIGCTGVAKAGEEEGITFAGAEVLM